MFTLNTFLSFWHLSQFIILIILVIIYWEVECAFSVKLWIIFEGIFSAFASCYYFDITPRNRVPISLCACFGLLVSGLVIYFADARYCSVFFKIMLVFVILIPTNFVLECIICANTYVLPNSSVQVIFDELPTQKFVVTDAEEPETCAICAEEYVEGDILTQLECKHQFHQKCLLPWLRKRTCPLCRVPIRLNTHAIP